MKQKLFLSILILIINASTYCQIIIPKKDYVPEIRHSRYSFAISINPSFADEISYGIMRENPDSTREVIFLSKDAFIRQACGFEQSRANPDTINYFKEYDIDVKVLDELWKLKYDKNPYSDEPGWSSVDYGAPSKAQYGMLKAFGIQRKSDYVFGDDVWRFLLKVSDPVWVGQYQNQP